MIADGEKLSQFEFRGEMRGVKFVDTTPVRDGVECDVYEFVGNPYEDLGIIRVGEGMATPRQRVSLDEHISIEFTEEGYIAGAGSLEIRRANGLVETYEVNSDTGRFSTMVNRGDEMQWKAGDGGLVTYEVCRPLYKAGRYVDLD